MVFFEYYRDSRPNIGVADSVEHREIGMPLGGIVTAEEVGVGAGGLGQSDRGPGQCAGKVEIHGCAALLEEHSVVFKPGFEAGTVADRAYAGIGLSVVFHEGERHFRG